MIQTLYRKGPRHIDGSSFYKQFWIFHPMGNNTYNTLTILRFPTNFQQRIGVSRYAGRDHIKP